MKRKAVLVFGHRGAAGEAPENTLTGFAHAVSVGVRAFELDVRLSADQQLVVLHDESLARTAGIDQPVGALTVEQLHQLDARLPHPTWPEPAPIPTLREVFTQFPDLDAYQVEIKRAPVPDLWIIANALVPLIREFSLQERVQISSFAPEALEIMRQIEPSFARALIGKFDGPDWIDKALELGCGGVCIPHTTGTDEVVELAHKHALAITGWPGNGPDHLTKLLAWDVNHITTDYPKDTLAFLAAYNA
jgi:glycerophosphoryl diester phosphodiesterase